MAEILPSDEALTEYFLERDVSVDITHESAPAGTTPYTTHDGTVDKVTVDGEHGVYLRIEVFVPLEDIPELDGPPPVS